MALTVADMTHINQRGLDESFEGPKKKRVSILVEFPDEPLECIVIQWDNLRPTVLVQMKNSPEEPIQFPGKRPNIPGNDQLSAERGSVIDQPLLDFINPNNGQVFGKQAFHADLLFSARAFSLLQPEPDLVLPEQPLWECRTEALRAVSVIDDIGILSANIN